MPAENAGEAPEHSAVALGNWGVSLNGPVVLQNDSVKLPEGSVMSLKKSEVAAEKWGVYIFYPGINFY